MDIGTYYTNTSVAVVRTCLPHALLFHQLNSPQMDPSGQDKEGMTKRDMLAHDGGKPEYQGLSLDMDHWSAAADRARWRTLAVVSRARRCREDE